MGNVIKDEKYYENKYPVYYEIYALTINGEAQLIGEFIEWLGENGFEICEHVGHDHLRPTMKRLEELICMFYDIDYKKYCKEKDACHNEMLADQCMLNDDEVNMTRRTVIDAVPECDKG